MNAVLPISCRLTFAANAVPDRKEKGRKETRTQCSPSTAVRDPQFLSSVKKKKKRGGKKKKGNGHALFGAFVSRTLLPDDRGQHRKGKEKREGIQPSARPRDVPSYYAYRVDKGRGKGGERIRLV